MTSTISFHGIKDIPDLLVDQLDIFTRYRDHPYLSGADQRTLFTHELAEAMTGTGVCASISSGYQVQAVCSVHLLEWDSLHFSRPMAKLTLAANGNCPAEQLMELVDKALSAPEIRRHDAHITAELDIEDYLSINTLTRYGFEIMDVKREFRWTTLRGVAPPKLLSRVRRYKPTDRKEVTALLDGLSFGGRFYRDQTISKRKTDEMYAIWLDKLLHATDDEAIALVFEKNGEIQGCGITEYKDLSSAGVPLQLMDKGLYMSKPNTRGYYPIIYSLAERALAAQRSVQTSVSINNHSAIRVLERMRGGTRSTRMALRLRPATDTGG